MNTMGNLKNSWYSLLSGGIMIDSVILNVYKEDVPEEETNHYVLIRAEGETDTSNKRSFRTESVVIVDIVTTFENNVDSSVVDSIDNQIQALVFNGPPLNNLSVQSGMQILNVKAETTSYLPQEDGTKKFYRKVSRYRHTIFQIA